MEEKPNNKTAFSGKVRLRLTIALPAIITLLAFGAGVLAINLCKLKAFDPFGKLRRLPFSFNSAYLWVAAYALAAGGIGFILAYFVLTRPMRKSMETLEKLAPGQGSFSSQAETETVLLAKTLSSIYPVLGQLKINQTLVDAIQSGFIWIDGNSRINFGNRKGLALLEIHENKNAGSFSDTIRNNFRDAEMLLSRVAEGLKQQKYYTSTVVELTRKNGGILRIGLTTSPVGPPEKPDGLLLSFRELSEIERLRRDLDQLDRLSALGRLASGLVHEIRNPLGSLMGLLEILREALPASETETREITTRAYQAASRIQQLLVEVLDFAGPKDVTLQKISGVTLLEQALEETTGMFPPGKFSLEKAYSREAPSPDILVDGEKLKQALVNILRNAMEAVNPAGTIRVTSEMNAGRYWKVSIFNTGSSIPSEESQKIFDPFYTTKPRGTGLGLPIARALITLQGGTLSVESIPSKGVTFYIQFPVED